MSLPPSEIPQGAIRFNTDSQRLEFYAQGEWWVMSTDALNLGRTVQSNIGARAVFAFGSAPDTSFTTAVDYINIASMGDATNFTNAHTDKARTGSAANKIFGLFFGGFSPSVNDDISKCTISSLGTTVNSGANVNASTGLHSMAGLSNDVRYLVMGGNDGPARVNTILHGDFSTSANALDFGDISTATDQVASCASPVRGIMAGGDTGSTVNTIEYVTIGTLGNAQDFGDLSVARIAMNIGCSNATRGVFMGGFASPAQLDVIDYITITSTGNATGYGDLVAAKRDGAAACSSTRAVSGGGGASGSETARIDTIEIATGGQATDFGDLNAAHSKKGAVSNGHGGL